MRHVLRLPRRLQEALWAHALREFPSECVGVLGTDAAGEVQAAYPLTNVSAQPETRYLADPPGLLRAFRAMDAGGLHLGAIYHSHPHGPARPSATDLSLASYRVPYLILDVRGRVLRAYLLPGDMELSVEEVSVEVT